MRWHEVTGERLAAVDPPDAGRRDRAADRAHRAGARLPRAAARRLPHSRVLPARTSGRRNGSSTSRTSSSGRPRSRRCCATSSRTRRSPDFRILLVLPAKPNTGNDDTRGVLGELIEADDDDGRLLACTLYARSGALADPVYVHAKIAIVDDAWLTLGSANLNEHSLFNDTEMNVVTPRPGARASRRGCGSGRSTSSSRPRRSRRSGRGDRRALEADQQGAARRRDGGPPLTHRLVRLPHVSRRSGRVLGPCRHPRRRLSSARGSPR